MDLWRDKVRFNLKTKFINRLSFSFILITLLIMSVVFNLLYSDFILSAECSNVSPTDNGKSGINHECSLISNSSSEQLQSVESSDDCVSCESSAMSQEDSQSSSDNNNSSSGQQESSNSSESQSIASEPETIPSVSLKDEIFSSVTKKEKADSSYLDDAVFIGDSITEGLGIYLDNVDSTILATRGLNPDTIFTEKVNFAGGEKVTILEGLKKSGCKKVYLMVGTNGIAFMNNQYITKKLGSFIDEIRKINGEMVIYIQSIPPVTREYEQKDARFSKDIIKAYNKCLSDMAKEKNVNFLYTHEVFRDDGGYLPSEKSPDGYHFNKELYLKWYDYLLCHVA